MLLKLLLLLHTSTSDLASQPNVGCSHVSICRLPCALNQTLWQPTCLISDGKCV